MDKDSTPPSRERVQRLLEKNIELENKRRKSAQSRIPSDPNAWQQIRENYESIILEDHTFSEQQNIEYALWQLHYRRIEELRAHFQSALSSSGTSASQAPKVPGRPDRVTKIRMQFKTFLSEAAGFYHDLILKIRAKYGLPLGYFSDNVEPRIVKETDGKKIFEVKKGLISCHRCLIYLGDLSRYKGLYGEGDSKTREYAAASSYYLQAASLWPSSGNPHHQLAILASYSGDELVAVYRYFRSLAVENPFVTARDNLIVAFEKNRQIFSSQSLGNAKGLALSLNEKRRVKGDMKHAPKNLNGYTTSTEGESFLQDTLKSFCIRFVRLHGILFTRTSLETFEEVLGLTTDAFSHLLSSGTEDKLPFGPDVTENSVFSVRVISTLIFMVHNVKKEPEGQTYAETVQRSVLLQNAYSAAFEISGHVLENAGNLSDPTSSYLIPSILVFLEWLACHPDVATTKEADKKQNNARTNFWNHLVVFLNKILLSSGSLDDNEDDLCFNNMRPYEEGETENRLALWEDFELRGFIPILQAQIILDFSRKQSLGSDSNKEKSARLKRILAAGRALANIVKVDNLTIWFDSRNKKFNFGDMGLQPDEKKPEISETTVDIAGRVSIPQLCGESEEEDEVIVFKPLVVETPSINSRDHLSMNLSTGNLPVNQVAGSSSIMMQSYPLFSATSSEIIPQQIQPISNPTLNWSADITTGLSNTLKNINFIPNGQIIDQGAANEQAMFHPPISSSSSPLETMIGKTLDHSLASRKMPVSRPARHLGPPPGFGHVASKQMVEPISEKKIETMPTDDYSWLVGYQMPTMSSGIQNLSNSYMSNNGFAGKTSFPFPGKQNLSVQNYQALDHLKPQEQLQQQFVNGNQQFPSIPEQNGQSIWSSRYIV